MVEPTKYFVLPYNPTAENMARYLLEEVCPGLLDELGVQAVKVVIWETEESCAEATLDQNQKHDPSLFDEFQTDSFPTGLHW